MSIRTEADRDQMFSRRALFIGAAQAGVGLTLAGRMAWLSIFEQEKYRLLAESNRVSMRLIPPRRGWIVDRAGKPLALNRPDYRLELVAEQVSDLDGTLAQIAKLLPLTPEDIARIHADVVRVPSYIPVVVAADLAWEQFSSINVRLPELPGLQPVRGFSRLYPDGAAFGHLLGYVGAPTREQFLETRDPLLMFPGYRVGKDGLEKTLDAELRGTSGARRVEVNARGRILRDLETDNDKPGRTVKLTIDRDLQAYAARRVGDLSASVVVMDTITGDLLCLLSSPAYDPNVFSRGIPTSLWNELNRSEAHPLINKSIQGLYPPGSTFKMTTAMAALEAGISPDQTVYCPGSYMLGRHRFHCWRHGGHGTVDMHRAITQSCDVYFYTMGRAIGIERLAATARKLGYGQEFDLPIPSQRNGIMPTPEWKRKRFDKDWIVAETINASIGQGYTIATPLQLAVMSARLASGRLVQPRLIAGPPPPLAESIGVPPEQLAVIHAGMSDVVNSRGGTAFWAKSRSDAFQIAGKTGSAQVRRITMADRRRGYTNSDNFPWKFRDHALFVSFAPVVDPRYACAVIVEHGSHGGIAAAPIARDVLTFLFEPSLANRALQVIEADRAEKKRKAEAAAAAAEAAALAPPPPPPATPAAPAEDTE